MIPKMMYLPKDQHAHAYWFEGTSLHAVDCGINWQKAVDFVTRAKDRGIGAYATFPVDGRQRVLVAAFHGVLKPYATKDNVVLDCAWWHKLRINIKNNESKQMNNQLFNENFRFNRIYRQEDTWAKIYYQVSWFDKEYCFIETTNFNEAKKVFYVKAQSFQTRLCEYKALQMHEVASTGQKYLTFTGNYIKDLFDGKLPTNELPYMFNHIDTWMQTFKKGEDGAFETCFSYDGKYMRIYIEGSLTNGVTITTIKNDLSDSPMVTVQNNPITDTLLKRLEARFH